MTSNQRLQDSRFLGRRAFLKDGTLLLSSTAMLASTLTSAEASGGIRFGLITDLHHADKAPAGSRHYRETRDKLEEAAKQFAADQPAFLVELGDFIDAADTVDTEKRYLTTINRQFAAICKDRHYVLGNHCVDTLTKDEFLGQIEQEKSYYSFDRGHCHFVVLDACFRSDGVAYGRKNSVWTDTHLPAAELEWLTADLRATTKPVVILAHQRLDVSNNHGVKNSSEIRTILETSGKVLAVFQGHSHQNDLKDIGGIHYCTLVAMVEGSGVDNNGYATVDIDHSGTIQVHGFRRQKDYTWPRQP